MQIAEAYAKITFANGRQIEQVVSCMAGNVHEALNFAVGNYARDEADKLTKQGKDGRIKHVEIDYKLN